MDRTSALFVPKGKNKAGLLPGIEGRYKQGVGLLVGFQGPVHGDLSCKFVPATVSVSYLWQNTRSNLFAAQLVELEAYSHPFGCVVDVLLNRKVSENLHFLA